MKMNNKGFAITGFLYAIFSLFLVLLTLLLITLTNSKLILQRTKQNVRENVSDKELSTIGHYLSIFVNSQDVTISLGSSYNVLTDVSVKKYDGTVLPLEITTSTNLNTNSIGIYLATYSLIYDGITYYNYKIIRVV